MKFECILLTIILHFLRCAWSNNNKNKRQQETNKKKRCNKTILPRFLFNFIGDATCNTVFHVQKKKLLK